jgi:hypothetical protein
VDDVTGGGTRTAKAHVADARLVGVGFGFGVGRGMGLGLICVLGLLSSWGVSSVHSLWLGWSSAAAGWFMM